MSADEFAEMIDNDALETIRKNRLQRRDAAVAAIIKDADLTLHVQRSSVTAGDFVGEDDAKTRADLIARATELGCFSNLEECTDEQLDWAIKAEEAAGAWLNQLERVPTDEAKSEAVRRLGRDFAEGVAGA